MLTNYFRIAWRNLLKNRLFSLINILGLSVGMTFAMLIGLWVKYESSVDTFHENRERVAIVLRNVLFNNDKITHFAEPLPLYDELKSAYPEVKRLTRLDLGIPHTLKVDENRFNKRGLYVDPDFLKIFSFPLVKGNPETVLDEPNAIVLTESLAEGLFGNHNPIGKIVRMDNQHDLIVTGVAKDVPQNSSLGFEFLVPFEHNIQVNAWVKNAKTQWGNNFLRIVLELNEGASMEAFSAKIKPILQQKMNDPKRGALFLHPLTKWHLYGEFKDWVNVGGRIDYVRLFAVVGLLVLLIACINFMNLSTARSEKRAKEVGIRKAVGSQRRQLIGQFLCESLLTAFFAFLLSLELLSLVLPLLKDLGFENISFDFTNISMLLVVFAACVLTGLLAGSYPALYLSSFAPVKVLKGAMNMGKGAITPRKILVVSQFTFSIALIISTVIVYQQIQHAKSRPLGYDPDNLISFRATSDLIKNYHVLKQELLNTGMVEAVSSASSPMTEIWNIWGDFSWAGKDPNSNIVFSAIMTGYDYDKTSGLKLKEGRFFSRDFSTDSTAVILNEAAVKTIGFDNPIGQSIKLGDRTLSVIGVIENIVMDDPFHPVLPSAILFNPTWIGNITLRLKSNADLRMALATIQPIFEKHNPAYPFEYRFVDQEFERKFTSENQVGKLAGIFAGLAIFISCLGLFGLAAYMAESRTKEIGVRKVLGATVINLWAMLSKDFIVLVLISCLIASPVAVWFMKGWLEKYQYRIEINWWVFVLAGGLALLIALLTVSTQAIKAALVNPVEALRYE